MSRIGERLGAGTGADLPRYIKHPPGGAGWQGDAKAIDAGSAMILDNNLSHLSHESCRHIGTAMGPGELDAGQNGTWTGSPAPENRSYDDVPYREPPTTGGGTVKAAELVAWDERTCHEWGPFPAIQDRPLPNGGYGPRKVRVSVHVSTDSDGLLWLVAALTDSPDPPDVSHLVMATAAGTIDNADPVPLSGGEAIYDLDLEAPDPVAADAVETCRADGAHGSVTTTIAELYVWLGFYRGAGSPPVRVHGASVYEMR